MAQRQSSGERATGRPRSRPTTTDQPAVTHPEKVLWPDDGITKGDLIAYYRTVAPVVLPHLRDRPLVLRPFPRGITGPSYYRQSLPAAAPAWLPRYTHIAKADAQPNAMVLI